jgi:hypothetical protein
VLIAGERGGALAQDGVQRPRRRRAVEGAVVDRPDLPTDVGYSMARTSFFPNATMNVDISPEYMGVGYVIGPRLPAVMFAGGVCRGWCCCRSSASWATT